MVKLTAVGLRNYIDKTRARRDAREQAIMDIYSKTGGIGLRRIFGSSPKKTKNLITSTDDLESTAKNLDIANIEMSYLDGPSISTKNLLFKNFDLNTLLK